MNNGAHDPRAHARRQSRFSAPEERAVTVLCAVYALRILGMYMVLPVLSPYAAGLAGASGVLTGLALGAYGLTQAVFQIPFGALSDRLGRKRAIFVGLVLFAAGSAVAARAETAAMLVVGRLLQGTGAVASAVVALTADLTRPAVRTQAMARVGVWLGASFAIGMTSGEFFARLIGVDGLFWVTAALSLVGGLLVLVLIPEPPRVASADVASPDDRLRAGELGHILHQKPLAMLYLGTFLLHLTLTAIFVLLPFVFASQFGEGQIWKLILPIIVIGLIAMYQIARFSDRAGRSADVLVVGGVLLAASGLVLAWWPEAHRGGVVLGLTLFILAVACLEPVLPSLTTRLADGDRRGAVLGGFHMSQFLGAFLGGLLGGIFLGEHVRVLHGGLAVIVLIWAFLARRMIRIPRNT